MDYHINFEGKDMYLPIDMYTVGIKIKPESDVKYKIQLLRKVRCEDWGTTSELVSKHGYIDCSTLAAMDVAETDEGVTDAERIYCYVATLTKGVLVFTSSPAEKLVEYVEQISDET